MLIIGLTGGIASGKSAVARILRRYYKAAVLDIDQVTALLTLPGAQLFNLYRHHFGERVIQGGLLDKKLIADIIFRDRAERVWINSVAHPILLNYARDFLVECQAAGVPLAVIEVPLLFDAGWQFLFDQVWAVYIHYSLQLQRLAERDHLSLEQATSRIRAQMPPRRVKALADVVLRNDKSYKYLRRHIANALLRFSL